MAREALLIIDMLRDFMEPDGVLYCGEEARKIIPYVKTLIENKRKEGTIIIFAKDTHEPDDKEFRRFPPHCIKGTKGAEIIEELKPESGDCIVEKRRFSAFFETDLDEILKRENIGKVHVVGVCTSICVMATVSDLCARDYEIYVHRMGVADFDREAHEFSIRHMERVFGAKII